MCCRLLQLLLWRQWVLQKRQPRQLVLLTVGPLLIAGLLLLIRFLHSNVELAQSAYWMPFLVDRIPRTLKHPSQYIPLSTGHRWIVTFTPVNEDTIKVMTGVKDKLDVITKGFQTEEEMLNFTSLERRETFGTLGGVVFLTANISSLFESNDLSTRYLSYKLRFPSIQRSSGSFDWHTSKTFPDVITSTPRDREDHFGGKPGYYREGFLTLQRAVDAAIIELIPGAAEQMPEISVKLRRFPYPAYRHDPMLPSAHLIISAVIVFCFCIPIPTLINDLVYDKEKMIKDFNTIVGLPNGCCWFAWFIKALAIFLVLSVVMVTMIFFPMKELRTLQYSDVTVVIVFLICYSLATIMFAYLISSLFLRAFSGCVVGIVMFFITWLPYFALDHRFHDASLVEKSFGCLLPNVALSCGFKMITHHELAGEGAQWDHVISSVKDFRRFGLGCTFIILVFDTIFYALLAAYLNAVLPGRSGQAKPPYFIFLPRYWGIFEEKILDEEFADLSEVVTSDCFQDDQIGFPVGIKMRKITKDYITGSSKNTALESSTLDLYDDEISVIYGFSGSGKSTIIDLLTGLVHPTSGTALVNDWDVRRQLADMRKVLGYCPQHEVLFELLTVAEHFVYYCKIKNMEDYETDEEIEDLLEYLDLTEKKDTQIRYLTRSCRRRVSIAIAFIGYPKTVLLDEPTLGIDPDSKRIVWEFLRERQRSKTILVTTQSAEEAEILSDRVAVINKGKMQCCGSPEFLASKYEVGYRLKMEKTEEKPFEPIKNFLEVYIPEVTCTETGNHVTFSYEIDESHKIEGMLADLEVQKGALNVINYEIKAVTLEDVLIKLATCSDETELPMSANGTIENETENGIVIPCPEEEIVYRWSFLQQLKGQLVKKACVAARNSWLTVIQALLPILIVVGACFIVLPSIDSPKQPPMTLTMHTMTSPQAVVMADVSNVQKVFGIERIPWVLTRLLKNDQRVFIKKVEAVGPLSVSMSEYLVLEGSGNRREFTNNLIIALDFHSPRLLNDSGNMVIDGFFNDQSYHSPGILLNVISNTIMGALGYPEITIRTINEPLPYPKSARAKVRVQRLAEGGHDLIMYTLVALAVILGTFAIAVVQERSTRAKLLQRVVGTNMAVYWLANFLWDMATLIVIFCTICLVFLWFGVAPFMGTNFLLVILVTIVTGWTLIPFTYVIARLYVAPLAAFSWMTVFNIVTGQLSLLVYAANGVLLKWILFTFFPNLCFLISLHKIMQNYYYAEACDRIDVDIHDLCIYVKYRNISHPCCPEACGNTCNGFTHNYLSWDEPGIGKPLVCLFIHGLVALWFLYFSECPRWRNMDQIKAHEQSQAILSSDPSASESVMDSLGYTRIREDTDVIDERNRLWSCPASQLKDQEAVLILGVKKCYGRSLVLNDINLGVHAGETVGLLGPAGAGKTALLETISGAHHLNAGQIFVSGHSVLTNLFEVSQSIGYCPQQDCLIDHMTVRENLVLVARMRGIMRVNICDVTKRTMESLLLTEIQDSLVSNLRPCERRGLQLAIALLGEPQVILLDNPTHNLDSSRRIRLGAILQQVKARGRTIILTVNSMQEAELLCNRVAVIINGQLQCLGSPQHLNKRYNGGWSLVAKMLPSAVERIESKAQALVGYLSQTLPGAVLCHTYEGTVYYRIPPNSTPLHSVFGIMELGKSDYDVESYSVTSCTFEHVLLRFYGSQRPCRKKRTTKKDGWNFRRFVNNLKRMLTI